MFKYNFSLLTFTLLFLIGCSDDSSNQTQDQSTDAQSLTPMSVAEVADQQPMSEIDKANALFEDIYTRRIGRRPQEQTWLGIKDDYDQWNNLSEEFLAKEHEINKQDLSLANAIDESKLDDNTRLSLQLQKQYLQREIDDYQWRHHNYPLNQMFGTHSEVASLLINQHTVDNIADAKAYIGRLNGVPKLFEQLIDGLNIREEKGIIPPKFVFPYLIEDSRNIITGAPFEDGKESTLFEDFKSKVNALEIAQAEKDGLIEQATEALLTNVKPSYERLIDAIKRLETKADNRDGAWKFPDGEAFFNYRLQRTTTTDLTAKDIHEIGLQEVARIHDEMRDIMKQVNFDGTLHEFFDFMRTDQQFYYPDTPEGRATYLKEATALIEIMKGRLDELFIVKPKADMIVKAVEPFREKSAGKAFYSRPSMDGSRPGIYYANLYRMGDMPIYQMEALAYHEGIPGHHMQLAIAGELENVPKFRKFGRYTAYTEGWGLYSELLPKDIGFYQDPYSDFGRLAMELWRACRLVVDTGIHAMQWTREQGIEFYVNNTPNPPTDAVKMVERHIVIPSQATAYKVGMMKIVELRSKAKSALGDGFDIREFHDVVLKNGPVPLNILESFVNEYIASKSIP